MFNPGQNFNSDQPRSPEKKIIIPTERALSYQMVLLMTHFPEIHHNKELTSEIITYWVEHYGIAFRAFCDNHPIIAQHIIEDRVEEDEVKDMVAYIKSHGASDEDIANINDVSKYLH